MSGFSTRAIHAGQEPDPVTGAVVPPIHMSATFAQAGVARPRGYEYSRSGNPTRSALETCIAQLENGAHGFAFASGLAAETSVLLQLERGDHVVYMQDVYGGTFRLFDKVMRRYGIEFSAVDATSIDAVEAAFREKTRLLWLESPTNPLLHVCDIARLAEIAHRYDALVCVDNTFATPYLQRPLELGADLVVHSSTKYLGGHSDVVGGCLVAKSDDAADRIQFLQNAVGAVPSPFDCWLVLRGLRTLAVRVARQSSSALQIAKWLSRRPGVRAVHYPGLESDPGHELASRQMQDGFGGMLSFELEGEREAVEALERLRVFTLAESLGAVESLAEHPGLMTHASVPPEERERIGLAGGLVRLSIGLEDVEDLIGDLEQALV